MRDKPFPTSSLHWAKALGTSGQRPRVIGSRVAESSRAHSCSPPGDARACASEAYGTSISESGLLRARGVSRFVSVSLSASFFVFLCLSVCLSASIYLYVFIFESAPTSPTTYSETTNSLSVYDDKRLILNDLELQQQFSDAVDYPTSPLAFPSKPFSVDYMLGSRFVCGGQQVFEFVRIMAYSEVQLANASRVLDTLGDETISCPRSC